MKRYTFRLENVRRVRRTQEELAKAELLAANSEVQRAIEAVQSRMAAYEEVVRSSTGRSGVDAFMKQRYFNDLASRAVVAAQQAQHVAESAAAERRAAWAEAAKRVKVLDRLDERRREEFRIEHERAVEKEVDDIVVAKAARAAR